MSEAFIFKTVCCLNGCTVILALIGPPPCPSTSCLCLIVAPLSGLASARELLLLLPSVGGTCTSLGGVCGGGHMVML